ncbi:MAG: hypothetical protein J6N77_04840 [Lachnospiraceae bacterium]|nr:hypothetical protein [Lachnospiraceae bacterium]
MNRNSMIIPAAVLFLSLLLFTPSTVFANKHDASETGGGYRSAYASDVYRWWQGRIPNDNSLIIPDSEASSRLGSACSYFSAAYMLVKMDLLHPAWGETPLTVINKARAIEAYAASWGLLDWSRLPEMYPEVTVIDTYYDTSGKSLSDVKSLIYDRMEKGQFIIACVCGSDTDGHYIFIDGFDEEGDLIIGDSARPGDCWSDFYGAPGHENKIVHIEAFTCDYKDPLLCSSIYAPVEQRREIYVLEN